MCVCHCFSLCFHCFCLDFMSPFFEATWNFSDGSEVASDSVVCMDFDFPHESSQARDYIVVFNRLLIGVMLRS